MQNIIHEHFNDKRSELGLHMGHNSVVSMHFHRCYELIYVIDGIIDCVVGKEDLHAGGRFYLYTKILLPLLRRNRKLPQIRLYDTAQHIQ